MRKLAFAVALTAVATLGACKKTGEGEYQVEKPVVGTTTDTVHTPSVDVGTRSDTITTPTVGTKKTEVKVPTVDVKWLAISDPSLPRAGGELSEQVRPSRSRAWQRQVVAGPARG